jgi:hypothetical protein
VLRTHRVGCLRASIFACLLLAGTSGVASAQAEPPAVYVVARGGYNAPTGPDTAWPSDNFTVGTTLSGLSAESHFTASGGSFSLRGAHNGWDSWRSIGGLFVYVRGNPGTRFQLQWECTQQGSATNTSSGTYQIGVNFSLGSCGNFRVVADPGQSSSDSKTTGGLVDGITSGDEISHPLFPDITYSLATSFGHWMTIGASTCCGPVFSASASFAWTVNVSAHIVRPGQLPPVAAIAAPSTAALGSPLTLDGSGSYDPDGNIVEHRWTIQRPGGVDTLLGPTVQHTWTLPGTYQVTLQVTDNDGQTGTASHSLLIQQVVDSDGDGVPDSLDQCPNTPAGATVDPNGCSASQRDTDQDGVTDDLDQCPTTAPSEPVNSRGCSLRTIILQTVGRTKINRENNYSEDTKVTASVVFAFGHPRVGEVDTSYNGRIRISEIQQYAHYYDGHDGATGLPVDIDAIDGQASITLSSLSDSQNITGPADARIAATAADLAPNGITDEVYIDQWVDQNHDRIHDWLAARANFILTSARSRGGEVGAVANNVRNIVQDNDTEDCGAYELGSRVIKVSPLCGHRLNTDSALTKTVLHEARHAWQWFQSQRRNVGANDDSDPSTPSNDDDEDGLVDEAAFPSAGQAFNFIEEIWAHIRRRGSGDDNESDATAPSSCLVTPSQTPTVSLCAWEDDAIAFANAFKRLFP